MVFILRSGDHVACGVHEIRKIIDIKTRKTGSRGQTAPYPHIEGILSAESSLILNMTQEEVRQYVKSILEKKEGSLHNEGI